MIYPSAYLCNNCGGVFNPYYGGFGHFNLPLSGAGWAWPGFTYPFYLQSPWSYAVRAGFVA